MPTRQTRRVCPFQLRSILIGTVALALAAVLNARSPASLSPNPSPTPILTTIHAFDGVYEGSGPTKLILGGDGNLYGTTDVSVFRMTPSGSLTVLHTWESISGWASSPLTLASDGSVLGAAWDADWSSGTVFNIGLDGSYSVVRTLEAGEGPITHLIQASDGDYYGLTSGGGQYGSVFKMTPAGSLTTLYAFDGARCDYLPGIIQANDGNFYGTCSSSDLGSGYVFRVTSTGAFTLLASFGSSESPFGLVQANDGDLYGVVESWVGPFYTSYYTWGLFRLTLDGALLWNNAPPGIALTWPRELTVSADGNLYGTTIGTNFLDGSDDYGMLFRLTPAGSVETVLDFDWVAAYWCRGPVTEGVDGSFYGTSCGGVYRVWPPGVVPPPIPTPTPPPPSPSPSPTPTPSPTSTPADPEMVFSWRHTFQGSEGNGPIDLVYAGDGNLYGASNTGVLRISPTGATTVLHSFAPGAVPTSPMILTSDGSLRGTTWDSTATSGTVFRIDLDGTYSVIRSLANDQGPIRQLIQASDGNFYGLSDGGGPSGSVVRITPAGALTTLISLDDYCRSVIQASNGDFYIGCSYGLMFRMTPAGAYTVLHPLSSVDFPFWFTIDGIVQAADGDLYLRVSYDGGFDASYSVSRVTLEGAMVLHLGEIGMSGNSLASALIAGTDGNLYGVTTCASPSEGSFCYSGTGLVFSLTPSGSYSILHAFDSLTDPRPGRLTEGPAGTFYGTTSAGLYSVRPSALMPTPLFAKQSPAHATSGSGSVTLQWSAVPGADYVVCWDGTPGIFCDDGSWQANGGGNTRMLSGLAPGTYYWQVRARTAAGTTDADNGAWWNFTVTATPTPTQTPTPTPISCLTPDPFVALGGGRCVNGGWYPPGMNISTPTPTPTPLPLPTPSPAPGSCSTPDPFVAMGGGRCVNGGWLPPNMAGPTPPPTPTPSPSPGPTPGSTPPPLGCTTPDPFVALGGGTCINGGWRPPTMIVPTLPTPTSTPPPITPPPSTIGCSTPDPFVALGGGTCWNGGWWPPGMIVPRPPGGGGSH